jgi:alpha-glucosidase
MQPSIEHWFRNAVLYQIYPRSFYDHNNDGIGDLKGIIEKLHYLKGDDDSIDIDVIWISPIFPSPMADFGYDVSNYQEVDPLFGNLDDFNQLVMAAHERGIKLFIDFIPNHTSDQHRWFQESRRSRDDPHRHWYTWRDPKDDGGPPNNWISVFGGPAWEFDEHTGQYYLHSFLKQQPDLNWENVEVRIAIKEAMCFWLELGVDGFRMDAVYWTSKDPDFRDDPVNKQYEDGTNPYFNLIHRYSKEGSKLYDYMSELADTLKCYKDKFMIIEASPEHGDINKSYMNLYERVDASVSAPFNFEGLNTPWNAKAFQTFIDSFQSGMHPSYVPVYCLGNHDQPRLASRLGIRQARSAAVLQLSLPGMPVIYYGDELGMTDVVIGPEDIRDTFELRVPGKGLGRDPERSPMQWNTSKNAGFSNTKPWLPIGSDYEKVNVDYESRDPYSSLQLYKRLLTLRKKYTVLRQGSYESISLHENVYCFKRAIPNEVTITVINFSDEPIKLVHNILHGKLLLSSNLDIFDQKLTGKLILRPHEAVIVLMEPV